MKQLKSELEAGASVHDLIIRPHHTALSVEDFEAAYERMAAAGVQFVSAPRAEPYGRVVVFTDIAGNKWDLIGPA